MRKIGDLFYGRGKDDFVTIESFVLLSRSFAAIGFAPKRPQRIVDVIHQLICWSCIFSCPYLFFSGVVKTMHSLPITILLAHLGVAINSIAFPLKAVYIKANIDRLDDIGKIFNALDKRYQRPQDQMQIRDSVKTCTRIFVVFCIVYWLFGTSSWLVALCIHEYPNGNNLPFIDWLPESNLRFWLHFIFEVVFLQELLQMSLTIDSFPALYIRALRTHVNLLTDRVSRLGLNPDFSDQENFEELVDCIVSHQELLQISDTVGKILSLTTFFQFTIYAVILCVCMLNMFVFGDASTKLVTLVYLLPVFWQTIPTCYQASMLEADSAKLPVAIFHCNWLALDKRCHKLIIYFMQRAQKEISFTAITLFVINLRTNLSIAKFSFTLYTFINEMGFGETLKDRLD
ncbi:PREDICTED: odorant receptor 43b-like [Bactrocera latifrons]|uniref:Odorant receptor n=1 Tax=Bactrocera latifrons TaxID=174628 RepID=A0A5H2WW96_BACLA|nr:PREDICTED: odorant receptor 43b-like [Bactrocera latifrons]